MKLYHAVKNGRVTSAVPEDYDKFDTWIIQHPEWILQEEVSRDVDILKVENGFVSIDEDFIAARAKESQRQVFQAERDELYSNAIIKLDGMIFQTRPSDLISFTTGIKHGVTNWTLKDNSEVLVTTSQLETVLYQGEIQALAIFRDYQLKVKTL